MTPEAEAVLREMPAGQLEYWCRTSIRDLIKLYGFENARDLIAIYLTDEAGEDATKWLRIPS